MSRARSVIVAMTGFVVAAGCVPGGSDASPTQPGGPETTITASSGGSSPDARTEDAGTEDSVPDDELAAVDRTGPLIGIAVPGGRASEVRDVEVVTGSTFDLIRTFARWTDDFPNEDTQALIDANRRLHVSIRPVAADGEVVPWADLATAQPGDARYDELVDWIDRVVALGPGTYFTINHEPETADSRANGSSEDFVAMWRRTVELLRERGGDEIRTVWTMTNGAFSDGRAAEWYPGDDVVDVVGADVYNWHTCQGTNRPWVELDVLMGPALDFAASHAKPLAMPELASVEDREDPERKAVWIRNATQALLTPSLADRVEFAIWFDVTAPGGTWPNCIWDHDSSPASLEAFTDFTAALGPR